MNEISNIDGGDNTVAFMGKEDMDLFGQMNVASNMNDSRTKS